MNRALEYPQPQAIADYLWHSFQIQPGYALCVALGQLGAINNQEALLSWVRIAIERHQADVESDLIEAIEADLLSQIQAAGLVDGPIETMESPKALRDRISSSLRSSDPSNAPNGGQRSNVIQLGDRLRRV